ncbi:MAG TPA: class I SAM-dependent methyltransferase [bacterium]|nr:class I SAM-dependent methyltransferase [bacterium]
MQAGTWQFDEMVHAGPEHLDAAYVDAYDRKAGYDPARDVAHLQKVGLNRDSTLVDLGSGTGALALAAAPFCRRVVAVDVSAPMVRTLEARTREWGIANVECVRAGFLTYEHHSGPADVVCSRHALHHLPDFWKAIALTRIAAVLRPGGVFWTRDLMYSFDPHDTDRVIERWLARASTQPGTGWTRAELETHVRSEYSTFTWLFEPMLERAGLNIQEREFSDSGIYAAYTAVRAP